MQTAAHVVGANHRVEQMLASATKVVQMKTPKCDPPCECPECETHFYSMIEQGYSCWRYADTVSDVQARNILSSHVKSMNTARDYLGASLEAHGDMILNRWRKRSTNKRAALLQQLEPALARQKWIIPDLSYGTTFETIREQHRLTYLLPYLETETLAKDASLFIGLLYTRTIFPPQDWAQYDHRELTMAWACGNLDVSFNRNCVIMYGSKYGSLVPWDEPAAHRSEIVGFPRARLILEKQSRILSFLRKVVEVLLGDVPVNEPGSSAKWKNLVQTGLRRNGDAAFWSSYTHQPFSSPPVFSIETLLSQARARLQATADHLWLLETEPEYLRRYAAILGDMNGVSSDRTEVLGPRMIVCEIGGDVDAQGFWQGAVEELEHASTVMGRFRDSIGTGQPLPRAVDQALGALEVLLVNRAHTLSLQLQAIIPQRPGFQHKYELQRDKHADVVWTEPKAGSTMEKWYREDPLLWCLMQMLGAPDEQSKLPLTLLLRFLDDHLTSASKVERSRVDEVLLEKLSDFATVMELLAMIRIHTPKCTIRALEEIKRTENRLAWRRSKSKQVAFPGYQDLGQHLQRFRRLTPPSGPRNHSWLEAFDAGHAGLQRFWEGMCSLLETHYRKCGWTTEDIDTTMSPIKCWESVEYRELLQRKRQGILAGIEKKSQKVQTKDDVFLPLPSGVGETPTRPKVNIAAAKEKTRPSEPVQRPTAENVVADVPQPPAATAILVSKRTYTTLRSMFPTTGEDRKGGVDWDTFVQSMENAGFSARNGGGSIVGFEQNNGGGKINFHRPHPEPKIDPVMLQSMGRRMNKWFGWTRETFILAGK